MWGVILRPSIATLRFGGALKKLTDALYYGRSVFTLAKEIFMSLDGHGNHTRAELEMEIIEMLRHLKIAPIVITRADGDNVLDTGRYNWEFLQLRGGGYTIVEALEDALNQTMAYLWAVEEERVPDITDIPESVRANMSEWNVKLLQRRWEKKQRERQELLGSS
jgi:hypothetical protein